jgi:superfamily I DNA/RNA helicase
LSKGKRISLSRDDALIFTILASISYRGRPINKKTYAALKTYTDKECINLENSLYNFSEIKAITYNQKTKEIHLVEKVIIEPPKSSKSLIKSDI